MAAEVKQSRVIVMIDICNSVALRLLQGEEVAAQMIVDRIHDIQTALSIDDPLVERAGAMEGDGVFLIGNDTFRLVYGATIKQGGWRSFAIGPTVRIAIGLGEFSSTPDGKFTKHSGQSIDLVGRILKKCPEGRVVLTESVSEVMRAMGFGHKLVRITEDIKGRGLTTWYEVNGDFVQSPGSRKPAEPNHLPPIQATIAKDGAMVGSEPSEQRHKYWRVGATKCALFSIMSSIIGAAFGLYISHIL